MKQTTSGRTPARGRLWWAVGAVAAATLIAVVVLQVVSLFDRSLPSQETAAGSIASIAGSVRVLPFGPPGTRDLTSVQPGHPITSGTVIETSDTGSASLRLATGVAIRLGGSTRVRVLSQSTVVLGGGALYLVSMPNNVGGLDVRSDTGQSHDARTGEELTLDAAGSLVWRSVP